MRNLVLCLALGAAPAAAQDTKPIPARGPRIAVDPVSFDFGKALQNKVLEKEFSVRNFGSEDLVIENVSTTCGCTVADGFAKLVKPGSRTVLRVRLETRSYSGRLERKVLIRSNDSANGLCEVRLEATVVPAN